VSLTEHRRRLPIVASLPAPDSRQIKAPLVPGAVPTPRYAVWELTLKCDQKCIHCGSRAGHGRPNELTTDEALAVVADLRALGVGELTVIGGEAYLRDDFITIVRAARVAGMRCTMTTGGYNLEPGPLRGAGRGWHLERQRLDRRHRGRARPPARRPRQL
jgi:hypothetical protein